MTSTNTINTIIKILFFKQSDECLIVIKAALAIQKIKKK